MSHFTRTVPPLIVHDVPDGREHGPREFRFRRGVPRGPRRCRTACRFGRRPAHDRATDAVRHDGGDRWDRRTLLTAFPRPAMSGPARRRRDVLHVHVVLRHVREAVDRNQRATFAIRHGLGRLSVRVRRQYERTGGASRDATVPVLSTLRAIRTPRIRIHATPRSRHRSRPGRSRAATCPFRSSLNSAPPAGHAASSTPAAEMRWAIRGEVQAAF